MLEQRPGTSCHLAAPGGQEPAVKKSCRKRPEKSCNQSLGTRCHRRPGRSYQEQAVSKGTNYYQSREPAATTGQEQTVNRCQEKAAPETRNQLLPAAGTKLSSGTRTKMSPKVKNKQPPEARNKLLPKARTQVVLIVRGHKHTATRGQK